MPHRSVLSAPLGSYKTKAALDYETKTSYLVTVSVSDGNGGSDSISVTINVTDVSDSRGCEQTGCKYHGAVGCAER